MRIRIWCCIGMLAGIGCARSSNVPTPGGTAVRSAPRLTSAPHVRVVSSDEAVMRLTNTRCDREVACSNVGSERVFVDRDACARELGHDAYVNLRAPLCPGGVDDSKLATCLADVGNERCNNPIDTIERLRSCRSRELCID